MPDFEDISNKTILFFDGDCGLCNRSVKFILRKEKDKKLLFSPLQSVFAKSMLKKHQAEINVDSMVLLEEGKLYLQSSAALRITKYLKGLWPAMMIFILVPPFLRNAVYNYIAKHRITWFGMANYCDMMTAELKKRFLE